MKSRNLGKPWLFSFVWMSNSKTLIMVMDLRQPTWKHCMVRFFKIDMEIENSQYRYSTFIRFAERQ